MANVVEFDVASAFAGVVATEGQIARAFVNKYSGQLLYNDDEARWYLYDGAIWRKQRKSLVFEWIHKLGVVVSRDAKNTKELQSSRFAKGVETLVSSYEVFSRSADQFDPDTFLSGEPNMTVNLIDAEQQKSSPDDMITRSLAVDPADFEDCPMWLEFLEQATGNDAELILFLQRWCGYCMTGDTREHTLVFIYGGGGNGKSVFVNTITGILGDYAVVASMDTFTSSKGDKHPTDLAMLRGARLVTASETEEGRQWDEARIKQVTGGDLISARFMRQDFFTFKPQFKLMIIGNHQPVIQNVDDALRRRFCMVPFTIKPEKPDPELEVKLRDEWPAILRWMLNGCLDWQRHGLPRPASVMAATAEYFEDQDVMSQWLASECDLDIGNTYKYERVIDLFNSWNRYSKDAGLPPSSIKGFSQKLLNRGLTRTVTKTGKRFHGVSLTKPKTEGDGW